MATIDWRDGLQLETEVALVCQQQEEYGVLFDRDKALWCISDLDEKLDNLYKEIRPYLSYTVDILETKDKEGNYNYVRKVRCDNGRHTVNVCRYFNDPDNVLGPFSRINICEPTLSRRAEVVKSLLKHGWKPTLFTPTGQPKITDKGLPVDSLLKVGEFGKALALWYTLNHRKSQINGFFEYVRPDGRISATLNTCATNTFRGAHKVVANIPRPTSVYGKEMRSLFRVDDSRAFVGADASGLELRMLAHHMKDDEFIEEVVYGSSKDGTDVHSKNMVRAGLPTRDNAKTFIYAFLYGAGDAKIGSIIGGGASKGKELKAEFFKNLPSLSNLIITVKSFAERTGWVPSIDKRKIFLRSQDGVIKSHTALNALLQANGSIIVKRAMVIADKEIKRRKLDAHQILFYHDELAYDCDPAVADEVGKLLQESFNKAGEYYNLRLPIDGEYKVGKDWSIH